MAVLPGVAYIEMARAAGELESNRQIKSLSGIIWASPIRVESDIEVTINLRQAVQGIAFEMVTEQDAIKPMLHARGKILLDVPDLSPADQINLSDIKKRCIKCHNVDDIYRQFNNVGFQYGTDFQMIKEISTNETEIISKIQLPDSLIDTASHFCLHPNILDGAIQSVFCLMMDVVKNNQPYLPFSLSRIDIYKALPTTCFVYGVLTVDEQMTKSPKFQIILTDSEANTLVKLQGFTARLLPTNS